MTASLEERVAALENAKATLLKSLSCVRKFRRRAGCRARGGPTARRCQ